MRSLVVALFAALGTGSAMAATVEPLDMEKIMANPDWIGQAVEKPYWSIDGQTIYYSLKRDGSPVRDLWRVSASGGTPERLDPAAVAAADGQAVFDREHRRAAFIRHGDVFLREGGRTIQVTRTSDEETAPRFSADGRTLQYRVGNDWFVYDIAAAVAAPAVVLRAGDDPDEKATDTLEDGQQALFSTLRKLKADKDAKRDAERDLAAADPGRAPRPLYVGKDLKIVDTELSPDGRWMLVVTEAKDHDAGKTPKLTHYVTDSGYAEDEDVRPYVGRKDPAPQSLLLFDLGSRQRYALKTDGLPGIGQDPLAALRSQSAAALRKAGKNDEADALKAPAVRPVIVNADYSPGVVWSDDGRHVAVELRAIDNKDRWIASVDFAHHTLVSEHRLTDTAWINWNFNDFGWLKDSGTLWYLSEESGYSQLYMRKAGASAKALTSGRFEVSHPVLSDDGRWFYLRSNRTAPYSYDVYRVAAAGGDMQRVTHYEGMDDFVLSPDGRQLAVLHSTSYMPSQLAAAGVEGTAPRELTDTRKADFRTREWIAPKIVEVPSAHGAGTIWAKFYRPADAAQASGRPAVIFVHGAGYLQNVHLSYPAYFREQMFHNLLVQRGYVVLDLDYRASEGYGRAWRTAIYRNMGHPELDDLLDGKAWLVKNQGVDPKRVGMYGGSYGGFMTLMSLLRAPGEFAAGAALRPVTDWTTYNHEYTSNILNDPQIDPEAYRTSSPIEYADKLADPLLIMHGLIDDNVLASDSIRLYQRFIELHKKNFWMSLYPMERHGFVHADSWYDEYRRIDELFREKLGQ
ncbi:dipeptidyl aminopeptidase/acylaminoacyl peptidase [Luteibacter rhizovicinus]|uniref:Dipeptidyl aminopeptidase/acylaminoacyl peptidase n=1 Tax=Luteibacter rhizovicinus TaxID=242606 RepID=A0A4R3YKM8_9GAMM|nr:prolyl oligopeptidase family serine peptidase [Luteibacter rhizovicinus]TCV92800.1 dipeptidyl aminopeptidase/acylaminoacyl peptidase [Luteibacter rhizovicinus]